MRRTIVALTVLAAAGVLAAGCGGNKSGSGGQSGGSPATSAAPSATGSGRGAYGGRPTTSGAGTPAGGTAVAIDNFAFSPATLKAKAGQQVTWTNKQSGAGEPSPQPQGRGRCCCMRPTAVDLAKPTEDQGLNVSGDGPAAPP